MSRTGTDDRGRAVIVPTWAPCYPAGSESPRLQPVDWIMKKSSLLVVGLFALSGLCGLVYELVWIRMLSHLLGGTTAAISTVLAVFMGGLAIGSITLGRRADTSSQPLRLYALLEFGIAVSGALVPVLIRALQPAYAGAAGAVSDGVLIGLRVGLVLLLLLPPTVLMGATLPVLSRYLVRRPTRLGRGLGLLYAVNTLGAVLGTFLSGFVFIPAFGLLGSTAVAVAGNLVAGLLALILARSDVAAPQAESVGDGNEPQSEVPPTAPPEMNPRLLAGIFATTGFAALGLELYWTRSLHHFLGNSTYAFSAMLTTYLCGLAGGSWLGGHLADRCQSPARLLGRVQAGFALAAACTVPLIWNGLPNLEDSVFLSGQMSWTSYILRRFLVAFAIMALPAFLSGMTFPLVNRIGVRSLQAIGQDVGRFYFANTTGSILGSLAAGFVLLPLLGPRNAILTTAVLSALIAVVITAANAAGRRRDLLPVGLILVLLLGTASPLSGHARLLLSDTQEPHDTVVFDREDPTAHTRVYRKPGGEMHMSVDGHHIGGTEPTITRKEKILAHLPMALVPRATQTLSVGLGSGVTLGTFALYPEIENLTCVEIVPGVVAGARYFGPHNNNVLSDPRVEVVVGDGIQYLLTVPRKFDIISSDSKLNPEYAGNSVILSRDYYELCARRLQPTGVMVQWLAIHFPADELRTVVRSFCAAFPHVELFWIDPGNILLAGSPSALVYDFDRIAHLAVQPGVRQDLQQQVFIDPYVLVSDAVIGRTALIDALGPGRLNTWLRPILEFSTVRQFRRKPLAAHEDQNFRWLDSLWDGEGMTVRGDHDPKLLERYRFASRQFMRGYGVGGGTARVDNGYDTLRRGLERNPGDPRLPVLLQMIEQERQAVVDSPAAGTSGPAALQQQAVRALAAGRADQALETIERALQEEPDSADLRYERIRILCRLQRWGEAEKAARSYLVDRPEDPRGLSQLGVVLGQQNQLNDALELHRQAVKHEPTSATYTMNLATTLARLEQFGGAAEAFARTYELNPNQPGAAYYAAVSYSQSGDSAAAWHWVEVCLDQRLVDPQYFLNERFFAQLRASGHWDEPRVRRAATEWR